MSPQDAARTLVVVPCSARKLDGGTAEPGRRLPDDLPAALGAELLAARAGNASIAGVNGPAMPAFRRYTGALYASGAPVIEHMLADAVHVLIVSGGYGLVHAAEPIAVYDLRFEARRWPRRVIPRCLEAYAARHGISCVRAFAGRSTSYAMVIRQTRWREAGVGDAILLSPLLTSSGALRAVPEAIGQALRAFAAGELDPDWRTRSGLRIAWEQLS